MREAPAQNPLAICAECQFLAGAEHLLGRFEFTQEELAGGVCALVGVASATPAADEQRFLALLEALCGRLRGPARTCAPLQRLLQQRQTDFVVRVLGVLLARRFPLAEEEWAAAMDCVYFGAVEALRAVTRHVVDARLACAPGAAAVDPSRLARLGLIRAFHLSIKLLDELATLAFLEHPALVGPLLSAVCQGQTALELAVSVQNARAFRLLLRAGQRAPPRVLQLLRALGAREWLAAAEEAGTGG